MAKGAFSDNTAEEKKERKVYISYENRESCMIRVKGLHVALGLSKYTQSQDTNHFFEMLLKIVL